MTIIEHLVAAYNELVKAQAIARAETTQPNVMTLWITYAVQYTEAAAVEAREIRAEEDTALETAVRA